jgi:hypothetical protein
MPMEGDRPPTRVVAILLHPEDAVALFMESPCIDHLGDRAA